MQISPRIAKPVVVVLALSPAAWIWRGRFFHDRARRESDRDAHPRDRRLDAPLHRRHARDHAAAPADRLEPLDQVPPDARAVRVLLRQLHFLTYVWLDQFFDVPGIVKDMLKRPFITVGIHRVRAMMPLALTSTTGWIRRLGGKRWQALHRLIYITAICGVIHYYWLVKADVARPIRYAAIVVVLLAARAIYTASHAPRARAARAARLIGDRAFGVGTLGSGIEGRAKMARPQRNLSRPNLR